MHKPPPATGQADHHTKNPPRLTQEGEEKCGRNQTCLDKAIREARWGEIKLGFSHIHQINLAIEMAVSLIRVEKPHSLSYQDRMRTSVPSITLV